MAASAIAYTAPAALPDVYRAINAVAKAISRDGISKARKNEQQGYSFRGIDDVYNALSALIAGADLCILPRMRSHSKEERVTPKGAVLFYVTVKADFVFVSSLDGTRHTVTTYGEAMDSGDKATNKAMSAAFKYAMMQVFCIPTEGMNDADFSTHVTAPKAAKAAAQKVAADKIEALRKGPQRAVDVVDQTPPDWDDRDAYTEQEEWEVQETQLERELRESIAIAQAKRPQTGTRPPALGVDFPVGRFELLRAFADLKKRYEACGWLGTYYAQLSLSGVKHSNEFPTTADGLAEARSRYKIMLVDVVGREARRA
jgi:hypothetical protein